MRVHRRITLGVVLVVGILGASAAAERAPCDESAEVAVLTSPAAPRAGRVRIVVAAHDGLPGEVVVEDPAGDDVDAQLVTHGGPPWSAVATIVPPVEGVYRVTLRREGGAVACADVVVGGGRRGPPGRRWGRDTEALYAAWIEHLFDAPREAELSFPSLEPVLRDPGRNFLHDHLGVGEDAGPRAVPASPDCADLPYLLRAYFAWKLGLPFAFHRCSRGSATAPPRCGGMVTNGGGDGLAAFVAFARTLADGVHSGSARTALVDDDTDFYPLPLTRAAIRPGTMYADPYGHTLLVVGWLPQTADHAGVLHAVDAQPDNTVARKRFWEGTFLFESDVPAAGAGFKAFRPLVADGRRGGVRPLTNAELRRDARFTPSSDEQDGLEPETFYARMSALVNPRGLEPARAYETMLDALVEQLETRVTSVDNGERFVREHPGTVVPMPHGAQIFETTGPWEDYATPSRDFRLIIAMNVLAALPRRIVEHPELFVIGGRSPQSARAEIERLHARRSTERTITYTRSDGSAWPLTVAELLARRPAFEIAYNPNDCVEIRWGAAADAPEAAGCRRRAPAEQRARMESYRDWFRDSRRPTR